MLLPCFVEVSAKIRRLVVGKDYCLFRQRGVSGWSGRVEISWTDPGLRAERAPAGRDPAGRQILVFVFLSVRSAIGEVYEY